jgi:hypothetical protein
VSAVTMGVDLAKNLFSVCQLPPASEIR